MKTKHAAIYVRVSTSDQHTDVQESDLREYAKRRGWEMTVFRDHGQSGAKAERPALDEMLEGLHKGKFEVILIRSFDRLARSLNQLLAIADDCKSLGVDLVSLSQNVDTTTPTGTLLFRLLAMIADFERELIRERVRAGVAHARKCGRRLGRPPLRNFSREEKTEIRQLRRRGKSIRRLAAQYGTTQFSISRIVGSSGEEKLKVLCTPETRKLDAK